MDRSGQTLGQVIRELREARTPKLSQEELGRQAGYRAGAGVSVSRIENGVTRPGPTRLAGIAAALGVTVRDLTTREAERSAPPPMAAPTTPEPAPAPRRRGASATDRVRQIQAAFERRNADAVAAAAAFNAAHDRARDEFFLPFVTTAGTVDGLPANTGTHAERAGDAGEARLRRELAGRGIAAALRAHPDAPRASHHAIDVAEALDEADREAAYNAVVATAILSTAPSTEPSERSARATRALLGGSSRSPGLASSAVLAALVATAASPLLGVTTLLWLARRTRRQNELLSRELDEAEATLAATQEGFDAVMALLSRATAHLDYIALHAGHAYRRWESQLPPAPRRWADLGAEQQDRLMAFVEVAACQVCVDTIDMTELLTATGRHQAELLGVADEVLTLTGLDVERLV